MKKKGIILILLLTAVVLVSMSSCTAFFGLFESPTVINVDGHNLVLPDHYTYVDGNGTTIVTVANDYNQQFYVTDENIENYSGVSASSFNDVSTSSRMGGDYNVTAIYSEEADTSSGMMNTALLDDNGTAILVDFAGNVNGSTSPETMVFDFAQDLQDANGLQKAAFSLLTNGVTTTSSSSSVSSSSSSSVKAPSDGGASDNDGDGVLEDQYGNVVNENMGAHDDSDSVSSSGGSSSGGSSSGGSSSGGSIGGSSSGGSSG